MSNENSICNKIVLDRFYGSEELYLGDLLHAQS